MNRTGIIFLLIFGMLLIAAGCEKSATVGEVVGQEAEKQQTEEAVEETPEAIEEQPAEQTAEEQPTEKVEETAEQITEEQPAEQTAEEQQNESTQLIEQQEAIYDVEIIDLKFLPTDITVSVGTTIRWTNKDYFYGNKTAHMIAAYDGTFRSGRLEWMDTFSYTFTEEEVGEHRYFDIFYKERMKTPYGKVTVIS